MSRSLHSGDRIRVPARGSRSLFRLFTHRRPISGRSCLWLVAAVVGGLLWDASVGSGQTTSQNTPAADTSSTDSGNADQPAEPAGGGESEAHTENHTSPVTPVLAGIILILLMAKIGGDLFERINLPAVLGELCVGIVLGNVAFATGWHGLDFLHAPPEVSVSSELNSFEKEVTAADSANHKAKITELRATISQASPYNPGAVLKMLAEIGVVLLLFQVGLESNVRDMLSVGASSMLVAVLGVIAPMILGCGVGQVLLPERPWQVHVFLGATLCATSVGITARVLKDLGRSQQRESRIILGAAVIDDVLGLIVLAVVKGVIEAGDVDAFMVAGITLKSVAFLFGAIVLGTKLFTRPLFRAACFLNGHGLLVATALVICFGFSWLASVLGLAPIVGAFAAGLILERAHYQELGRKEKIELEEALQPLASVLVPVFFVQMGIMVQLESFTDPAVWGLAAALTFVAVLGKQVCAWGVLEKGLDRLSVGIGMIPRGEVGLIFAAQGVALQIAKVPVIQSSTYSAVVVMVILTTLVTPPVLKWSMTRRGGPPEAGASPSPADAD